MLTGHTETESFFGLLEFGLPDAGPFAYPVVQAGVRQDDHSATSGAYKRTHGCSRDGFLARFDPR